MTEDNLLEREIEEHVLEIYETIFKDLNSIPLESWETETHAFHMMSQYEELEQMLSFYVKRELYERCAVIKRWLDELDATYSLVEVKIFLRQYK